MQKCSKIMCCLYKYGLHFIIATVHSSIDLNLFGIERNGQLSNESVFNKTNENYSRCIKVTSQTDSYKWQYVHPNEWIVFLLTKNIFFRISIRAETSYC